MKNKIIKAIIIGISIFAIIIPVNVNANNIHIQSNDNIKRYADERYYSNVGIITDISNDIDSMEKFIYCTLWILTN